MTARDYRLSGVIKRVSTTGFKGCPDEGIYVQATQVLPAMVTTVGALRRKLERAATTGSRRDRPLPVRREIAP